ncbi:dihydromonapterin reductase [Escherichia coli]|nr:dihydromonapterin reductase [Escherichia coli]EEU1863278.1 dihydromonapterin reductase [Escherichia coli]EJD1581703.1 dihydromonapterin reductase [Escherichia coli]EJG4638889.1 dihydromonapterin reductase [Escherichia coli]EJG9384217.1 dihydromonapterin reductase [Escherichia coli]
MGKAQPLPILITGGGRRIGLALAWHFINQKQPVIVSYRTHYPAIDGLIKAGAQCIQADFSTNDGVMAEKPGAPLADVLACMMQIHVNTPYLLNHALERLLRGHGHAASDIIHFTDYVVERGSDKHVAYAASKAALDNMTRSFARKLAPEVKVNSIAPSLILFNEHDDAEYRQQALNKSLMKTAPGEKEVIDLVDYLLTSCFVTGRSFPLDGGRHLR